ncbi:hypothetical protein TNCV_566021 [Trichonephila clavipes]|nr:hypothetical protein TNCV_566021 [Trichonephila clavipes]
MSHKEKKTEHINSLQSLNDVIHWSPSTIRELGHLVAPTGGEQVADACLVEKLKRFQRNTSWGLKKFPLDFLRLPQGQNTGFPASHKTSPQCPAVLLPPSPITFQDVKP